MNDETMATLYTTQPKMANKPNQCREQGYLLCISNGHQVCKDIPILNPTLLAGKRLTTLQKKQLYVHKQFKPSADVILQSHSRIAANTDQNSLQ